MKINSGVIKVIVDRARNYVSYITFLMVLSLYLDKHGWNWWYVLVICALILWMGYDVKHIIGKERDFIWTRPGVLNDMRKQIKEIHEKVK